MSPVRTERYYEEIYNGLNSEDQERYYSHNGPKMTVTIRRNGQEIKIEAVCDDCSFYTILNVCPGKVEMKNDDFFLDKGTEIIYGKVITGEMYFNGTPTKENIIFAKDQPENIIGWYQLKDMGLLKVNPNNKHVIIVPPVILDNVPKPKFAGEVYLKKHLISDAKRVIASWVRNGIIERCNSVCNSPVTLTVKPVNGKVKILFHYSELNESKSSESTGWEASRHEVIASVKLGESYSVLRLYYGEWRIPLDTNTKYKTTFTFLGKKYVWNRLPGKYCKTPEILTKTLSQVLDRLPPNVREHVTFFRDSMLISANTKKECLEFTDHLSSHLEDSGFEIHEKVKQICQKKVEYLGREICPEGIRLGPSYLEKVRDISSLRGAKELKKILGMLEDARRFTPGFGVFASILYQLVNEKDFYWNEMHKKALDDLIKEILKNRLIVPGLSENESCTVEVFVKNNVWMAEVYNSARKQHCSLSGTLKPVKNPQKLEVKELKAMKEAWGTMGKELKDREIIWEVQCPEVASYQRDPSSVEVNKKLDLSFLLSPQHKIKVVNPSSRKPPIKWPEYV